MNPALDAVNAFLRLTSGLDADIVAASALLGDDVRFIGPLMQTSGRSDYLELLRQFLPAHVATRVLQQFVQDEDVCSIDELVLRTPAMLGDLAGAQPEPLGQDYGQPAADGYAF